MDNLDKQSSTWSLEIASTRKKRAGRKIYKGKYSGKWVCQVREPNKKSTIWLGNFSDPEAPSLPRANSSSHQDIQVVAAKDFRPSSMNMLKSCSSPFRISGEDNDIMSSEICSAAKLKSDVDMKERCNGCLGLVVDEEEIFNMPVLLDSMAEGMLLTPLAMKKGFNWSQEVDDEFAFTLWAD